MIKLPDLQHRANQLRLALTCTFTNAKYFVDGGELHVRSLAVVVEEIYAANRADDATIGGVNQVAEFHDEVHLVFLELDRRLLQLAQRLSIMSSSRRWLVGVVEIGDEANPQTLLVVIGKQRRSVHGRSRSQKQSAVLEKASSAQTERMFFNSSHGCFSACVVTHD